MTDLGLGPYTGFGLVNKDRPCPVHMQDIITAMFSGHFRDLESDRSMSMCYQGVEYSGWFWQPRLTTEQRAVWSGIDVVADHGPGGVHIEVHAVDHQGEGYSWSNHKLDVPIDEDRVFEQVVP
jgi:hypothetical protein